MSAIAMCPCGNADTVGEVRQERER